MGKLLTIAFLLIIVVSPLTINAQKTFKAVCDKTDGTVKIVAGEDKSPDMIPIKGGFPFFQVAQKWVQENYPDGKCNPDAIIKQNQATTPSQPQPTIQPQSSGQPQPSVAAPGAYSDRPVSAPLQPAPSFRYRNTSLSISLLFSDLGKVYSLDPPLIPGVNIAIEQLLGKKIYGGTGLHLNSLIGKTDESAGVSTFYNFRIPVFAGYRQYSSKNHWKVELGLAANTKLQPSSGEQDIGGEIPADHSINSLTRVKVGKDRYEFQFGIDIWLTDILSSYMGFQMTVLSIGLQYNF